VIASGDPATIKADAAVREAYLGEQEATGHETNGQEVNSQEVNSHG
jgi:hypothetical protein